MNEKFGCAPVRDAYWKFIEKTLWEIALDNYDRSKRLIEPNPVPYYAEPMAEGGCILVSNGCNAQPSWVSK